jgi:threonine dehydratase
LAFERQVLAAEPSGADDSARSFRAGHRIQIKNPHTIADALLTPTPGLLTFEINRTGLADVVTVTDPEIVVAMRLLWERLKLVVEPSGAVALAALLQGSIRGSGPALVVISGGNVDFPAPPAGVQSRS